MNADLSKTYYLTIEKEKHYYWHNPECNEPKAGPVIIPQGTSTIEIFLKTSGYNIHSWGVKPQPPEGSFTAPSFAPDGNSIKIINANKNENESPINYHVAINVKSPSGEIINCDPEVEDEGTHELR
ncbi:hypothetical protein [Kordiimonas aquimaris]|uniref:hypothetical protein n=1 Tax=Kordiimonas aquimaris TaxID=707591 RepID=UPI0021D3A0C7|nr:hypothetical protein [Kordiimonas aquimaris]